LRINIITMENQVPDCLVLKIEEYDSETYELDNLLDQEIQTHDHNYEERYDARIFLRFF
jgi:hypothetical protein